MISILVLIITYYRKYIVGKHEADFPFILVHFRQPNVTLQLFQKVWVLKLILQKFFHFNTPTPTHVYIYIYKLN